LQGGPSLSKGFGVASDCKEVVTDIAEETLGKYATVISEINA
jgi:hypothetical protein